MKPLFFVPLTVLAISYTAYPANTKISAIVAFVGITATAFALFRLWQLKIFDTCIIDKNYKSAIFTANVANLVWLVTIQYHFTIWLLCTLTPTLLGIQFVVKQFRKTI